jgi:hypothetical protein
VSLSNSTSALVDQTQQAGETAKERLARRNALPCGSGKRPAFEIVMFFEKATPAVSTTPTTSTGTVGATPTPTPTATPAATPEGTTASKPAEGATK